MRTIRINFITIIKLVCLTCLLNACTHWLPDAHQIEIQQGNIIHKKERDALKLGMTKNDVINLLGNAVLHDPYHPNRWDYIYTIKSDEKENRKSRLTILFKNEKLVKIDDTDFNPEK